MLKRLGGAIARRCALLGGSTGRACAADPITIGFGMALTGGLAPNGKAALLAMQIWEEEINAKGGLLGRPVKLVYYDDQSNPSTVPGIYTKLLDVDKVDLVVSGYATNMVAPAMPVDHAAQAHLPWPAWPRGEHRVQLPELLLHRSRPAGRNRSKASPKASSRSRWRRTRSRTTLALVGADAEFPRNAMEGARELAKEAGLKIVYDKTYPPTTTDYTPIVRGIQATNPDLVFVASYPPDTVGMIRAASEVGLKAKLFGGGMVGLQATAIKTQLGPLLNGIVDYDFWLPVGPYATPEGARLPETIPGEVRRRRR